jgi:aryl-alcohol dehydrogenase-like predicted oxidoreductase
MQTRKLGNSDLHITPVGCGAWAIGGSGWQFAWGSQDDKDSIAAIHRSVELGVHWIDTAAVYGLGHSEEVVARALKDWRGSRPYVFTKCGLRWGAKGEVEKVLSTDSIRGKSYVSGHFRLSSCEHPDLCAAAISAVGPDSLLRSNK